MGFIVAESRFHGGVDDQAGHITVLRRRRAMNDFHGLHGIHRELVGKDLSLLISGRLAVHQHGRVRVFTQGMEKAVGVSDNAGCGVRDNLAETDRRIPDGQCRDEGLIDVGVSDRGLLNEVVPFGRHVNGGDCCLNLQVDIQPHGKARPHLDIPDKRLKALARDRQVVGVEGNIFKFKFAGTVGSR